MRVREIETRFDEFTRVLAELEDAAEKYRNFKTDLAILKEYMDSGQWKADFEADEAGEIPDQVGDDGKVVGHDKETGRLYLPDCLQLPAEAGSLWQQVSSETAFYAFYLDTCRRFGPKDDVWRGRYPILQRRRPI